MYNISAIILGNPNFQAGASQKLLEAGPGTVETSVTTGKYMQLL